MPEPIKIVIADALTLYREGLRCLLNGIEEFTVVGEAADGYAVVEEVRRKRPDVLLLEIPLPKRDALDTVREVAATGSQTKTIALSGASAQGYALRILRSGARGFVFKSSRPEELAEAVRRVHRGQIYLPGELQRSWAERYFLAPEEREAEEQVTDRELQVLCLLATGHTNKEIAGQLRISVKTVDTHRTNILKKLNLRNNADLARFALRKHLIAL